MKLRRRRRYLSEGSFLRGMRVKVTKASGKYEFITPTSAWQTLRLDGLEPEDFKVAEDLFYVGVTPVMTF